jgi:hypothetical protein
VKRSEAGDDIEGHSRVSQPVNCDGGIPSGTIGPVKTTTQPCPLCREPADVTDWGPVAQWLAVEGCQCGGFLVWTPLWNGRLARLPDMERKDLLTRVQAARACGHEAWVTTRIDGRLVVETDRPGNRWGNPPALGLFPT